MKNLRSILLALTVLLLATAAQAQTTNVKASIPFNFVVGNHAYSAGEYTVKSMSKAAPPFASTTPTSLRKGLPSLTHARSFTLPTEQPLYSSAWATTTSSIRFGRRAILLAASSRRARGKSSLPRTIASPNS